MSYRGTLQTVPSVRGYLTDGCGRPAVQRIILWPSVKWHSPGNDIVTAIKGMLAVTLDRRQNSKYSYVIDSPCHVCRGFHASRKRDATLLYLKLRPDRGDDEMLFDKEEAPTLNATSEDNKSQYTTDDI